MIKLKKAIISLLILGVALAFITGIGVGEAYRTYSKLKIEGCYGLGETIKSVVDSFLGAGVPLKQFSGFDTVSKMVLTSDPSIHRMTIVNNLNEVVFSSNPGLGQGVFRPSKRQDGKKRFITDDNDDYFRIRIPLETKFEKAGELRLEIEKRSINDRIAKTFKPLGFILLAVILLYLIQIYIVDRRGLKNQKFWVTVTYSMANLIVIFTILFSLIDIYNEGIQKKTDNLTSSLAHKLSYIKKLDLEIDSFKGIDTLFDQYRHLNNEISYIALKVNGKVIVDTSKEVPGKASDYIRYARQLDDHEIFVWVDKKIVYKNLWRSSKNFLILFVAALFMSALFLNLMFTLSGKQKHLSTDEEKERSLAVIKPVFFLGVFIEALYASFLPQYFETITAGIGASANVASFLFTVFFISYGVILFPAASYCQRNGEKGPLLWSVVFIGLSSFLMAVCTNYYTILFIRLIAGFCQGVLFMAVQSYILKATPLHRKTRSMAIVIIQYNGGRIAGTAIGALAVNYFDMSGVFLAGGVIAFFLYGYVAKYIPRLEVQKQADPLTVKQPEPSFGTGLKTVLKDIEHLKASFLIGVNAKLVMIGVICFAIPLVMERSGFTKEDIGLVLMLYSAGVLISSMYSSRLADKTGNLRKILFRGNQGSGIGLVLIGLTGLPGIDAWAEPLMALGAIVLGLSHGFIAAPITTHISGTRTAKILGAGPSISVFRVFERAGNILGPLIVGQLLVLGGYNTMVISFLGVFIILCGFLFLIRLGGSKIAVLLIPCIISMGFISEGFCLNGAGPDWFKFTKNMPAGWEVTYDDNDPLRFTVSSGVKKGELEDKKIIILVPKRSSAYVSSAESVLHFFSDKKLYPTFEIINFHKDLDRGRSILEEVRQRQVDLVFAMGSLSVDFMYNNFKNQTIPVVTICAKDPVMMKYISDYSMKSGTNFAFTSINIPVKLQMVYFKELIPDLKNIGIMYARNNTSAVMTQALPLKEYAKRIGVKVFDVVVEDQKNAVSELELKVNHAVEEMRKNDSGLKNSIFWVTGSTSVFNNFGIINQHAGSIPVIGASPSMVKGKDVPGAVMAIGVGFENNAQLASIYAEKILKGEKKPGEFEVGVIKPPDIAINFKMVKKIDMKIPFSFFELTNLVYNYRGEIVKSKGSILSDKDRQ